MIETLQSLEARFLQLEAKSTDPVLLANGQATAALMKEYRQLEPTVSKFREWQRLRKEAQEAKFLADTEQDHDLAELANAEYKACLLSCERLEQELRLALIPKDPNDDRNVIVEIRAGAGGEEAALFAAVLYRMYTMYAENTGFHTARLGANETELGGFREISFSIEGDGAYSRFKFESGVHRVQRVPITESQGRIQTSTVTVAVLPEAEDVEIEISAADIKMESCKSSGAGGQHINKTESAVRLTHLPTGIVVECQEERSQFKNRDKAMKMLRAKLYDIKLQEQNEQIAGERRAQVGTGDRSERIRTYNYPQNRVTDHRIGLTLYHLDKTLNGDLDELIDALLTEEAAQKTKKENA
ncbi:MAG: peptide chain release factor 1 [Ruminococcaceae bacterium]|nr:peptide chain release factor 1 [Oscillospiraceae bacterium]